MFPSNYTDQQIDDFIMNRLPDKDKKKFEEVLTLDSKLNERLASRRLLVKGIEAFHSKNLKQKLKNIHSQNFNESTNSVKSQRKIFPWISIAAAIALLIGAFLWFNNTPAISDDLFANHFSPYELSFTQRSTTSDKELLHLEDTYNKGAYKEAIPLFEKYLIAEKKSPKLLLGLGISQLALQQNQEALNNFNSILETGDILYKDHAIWYSALAHLNNNDTMKTKELLNQLIQDKNADHFNDAKELLRMLH